MKARRFLCSRSWVGVTFWAWTDFCWKTHSLPLKRVNLRCFTAPCSMSSWYTWTPVSPLLKMNVTPWLDTPPNHDVGRVMASLHHQNVFLHLAGCLSTNLVVVPVVLLNFGDFLVLEEDVFVPILRVPLLLSIESRSGQDWRCVRLRGGALSCVDHPWWGALLDWCVQLLRHDLFPERISANPLVQCFDSGLSSQIFRRPNCLQPCRVPQNF